jgi:peptidyl-prolyl cis-trans isomerase C
MNAYRILLPALALGVLIGCQQGGSTGAGETAATGQTSGAAAPVATVNGKPIGQELFEFYAKGAAGKAPSELTAEQREQVLDSLVRAELVAQQAVKDGLEKDAETANLLALTRLEVLQRAAQERYLKDKQPTEQELRAEYETQIASLSRQEYKARHILVATEDFAKRIIGQLDKGANFAEIARRESMDGSKAQGGDLGWFTPDRMVQPFAQAVVALQKGQYTKTPVQTQFGWHVIRLEDTRDLAPPPYDAVKERLGQIVMQKKFKTYTDELMKTAKVEKKT